MDVMIDIETLGTSPGCAVLSIGAVGFDRATGKIMREFYRVIDLKTCLELGMTVDAGTLHWWLKQSEDARSQAFQHEDEFKRAPAWEVAGDFYSWMSEFGHVPVWSHGLTFDLPILERFLAETGHGTPWAFWAARDTRTVYDVMKFNPGTISREGTYHNALDDAKHQVKCLHSAMCGLVDGIE